MNSAIDPTAAREALSVLLLDDAGPRRPSFRPGVRNRALLWDVGSPLAVDLFETLRYTSATDQAVVSMLDRTIPPHAGNDWVISLDDYVGYATAAVESHIVGATDAGWAVIVSHDGEYALAGGEADVVRALMSATGRTSVEAATALLDTWRDRDSLEQGLVSLDWIEPLIRHLLPTGSADEALQPFNAWLGRR